MKKAHNYPVIYRRTLFEHAFETDGENNALRIRTVATNEVGQLNPKRSTVLEFECPSQTDEGHTVVRTFEYNIGGPALNAFALAFETLAQHADSRPTTGTHDAEFETKIDGGFRGLVKIPRSGEPEQIYYLWHTDGGRFVLGSQQKAKKFSSILHHAVSDV